MDHTTTTRREEKNLKFISINKENYNDKEILKLTYLFPVSIRVKASLISSNGR